jgi:hypothetical protein
MPLRELRAETSSRLCPSPGLGWPYRTAEVSLAKHAGRPLMTTTSRRFAFAFSILAAGLALAAPVSAQLAGGRSAFDQRPGPEYVQFRDSFWSDRTQCLREVAFCRPQLFDLALLNFRVHGMSGIHLPVRRGSN